MDQRQEDKLTYFGTLKTVLDADRPVWAGLGGFKRAADRLTGIIAGLGALAEIQRNAREGRVLTKAGATDAMIDEGMLVAGAISSLAGERGETVLAAKFDLHETDFRATRDELMDDLAQTVFDAGQKLLDDEAVHPPAAGAPTAADHGLTDAALQVLKARIGVYAAAVNSPRAAGIDISAATGQVPELIRQADAVIKGTLDKLALQFKKTAPDFFNKFQAARRIVNTGACPAAGSPSAPAPAPTPA